MPAKNRRYRNLMQAAGVTLAVGILSISSAHSDEAAKIAAIFGFGETSVAAQREIEKKFDAAIDPADLRAWLQNMSSAPNHVGSPHDKANAEFVLKRFKAWGWDAHIETFDVLYPTPREVAVEMLSPKPYKAKLRETPVPGDTSLGKLAEQLPPYTVYGADGDVTADLVYVNFGMPDDYKVLERAGISVQGKIVIARYGQGWRGLKPKLAQQHGAIGCIIYSDPSGDGYADDDVYPVGSARPSQSVQRGSVQDIPVRPGDPLTPNVGATKDAKRLSRDKAETLLKIPVLPLSYEDALPLLQALDGPVTPSGWHGALPITYHYGPGPAKVHLTVKSDWSLKPVYNVIATLRGAEFPDQWIVRGNHRDGWVFGASDPLSGHVAMMAEAQAIGRLVAGGWRPKRTLIYASWDGEEPGMLGSTEWAEAHADELTRKAVLYLNSDSNGRGFLQAAGSHSLQHFVNDIAKDVTDPQTGVTVHERLRAKLEAGAFENGGSVPDSVAKGEMPIGALGTGSDFTPFLQHLGIATLNLEYGGEDASGGVYHSAYDSFDHYVRFGDPTFAYGAAMARTLGRAVLRVSQADVLPHRFADLADTVSRYADEVQHLADEQRTRAQRLDKLLSGGTFKLAADPTKPRLPPAAEAVAPHLEFAVLDNAIERLKKSAGAFDEAVAKRGSGTDRLIQVNAVLATIDRAQLEPGGLPGRPWYKSLIYAPGVLTGYGVKTLPGIREAIEDHRWDEANRYIVATAKVLDGYSAKLDGAAALLK